MSSSFPWAAAETPNAFLANQFYNQDPGTNYSQARYLCYYLQQRGLLEKEGVRFIDGKVVAATVDEAMDLDELIWGPED